VTKAGEDSCQVAMTSAFHELGNVPSLVIQDELKKISLRVSKIIARVQEIRRLNSRNTPIQQPSQKEAIKPSQVKVTGSINEFTCCGMVSKGLFCGNCGKKLKQLSKLLAVNVERLIMVEDFVQAVVRN